MLLDNFYMIGMSARRDPADSDKNLPFSQGQDSSYACYGISCWRENNEISKDFGDLLAAKFSEYANKSEGFIIILSKKAGNFHIDSFVIIMIQKGGNKQARATTGPGLVISHRCFCYVMSTRYLGRDTYVLTSAKERLLEPPN